MNRYGEVKVPGVRSRGRGACGGVGSAILRVSIADVLVSHVSVCLRTSACGYVCMYLCMCVCVCVCVSLKLSK